MAQKLEYGDYAVADYLAENDPVLSEKIAVHDIYGEKVCGWKFGN